MRGPAQQARPSTPAPGPIGRAADVRNQGLGVILLHISQETCYIRSSLLRITSRNRSTRPTFLKRSTKNGRSCEKREPVEDGRRRKSKPAPFSSPPRNFARSPAVRWRRTQPVNPPIKHRQQQLTRGYPLNRRHSRLIDGHDHAAFVAIQCRRPTP